MPNIYYFSFNLDGYFLESTSVVVTILAAGFIIILLFSFKFFFLFFFGKEWKLGLVVLAGWCMDWYQGWSAVPLGQGESNH